MNWFYRQPGWIRAAIIVLGLAILAFVLWVGISSYPQKEEQPPSVIVNPLPTETTTPDIEPEPVTTEEPPTPANESMEPVEPITELSQDEITAAQEVVFEGFPEWLHFDSRETVEERQQRISPWVAEGSPMWTANPVDAEEDDFDPDNPSATAYSIATMGTMDPIGGTAEDFRVLTAVTIQFELTTGEGANLFARQYELNYYYELSLSKESGEWKLFNYEVVE